MATLLFLYCMTAQPNRCDMISAEEVTGKILNLSMQQCMVIGQQVWVQDVEERRQEGEVFLKAYYCRPGTPS